MQIEDTACSQTCATEGVLRVAVIAYRTILSKHTIFEHGWSEPDLNEDSKMDLAKGIDNK